VFGFGCRYSIILGGDFFFLTSITLTTISFKTDLPHFFHPTSVASLYQQQVIRLITKRKVFKGLYRRLVLVK
jgi:hypothetical protein